MALDESAVSGLLGALTTGGDHDGVRRHDVGPLRRQRGQVTGVVAAIDPVGPPVPAALDELRLLAGQRMERMRHPHPQRLAQITGIECTRRLDPTAASRD